MTLPDLDAIERHREEHRELHQSLVLLLDDYQLHHPGVILAHITADHLFRWSHSQTVRPCDHKQSKAATP